MHVYRAQVLRTYADALLPVLLRSHENPTGHALLSAPMARPLMRELLTTCLLRPVIMYCWPHNLFKVCTAQYHSIVLLVNLHT